MEPQTPRFAVVTPSYYRDFERCRLLTRSIERHLPANVIHHIIVERRDQELFSALQGERAKIWVQEDLVTEKFIRLPFLRKWRFSLKTLPIRGWIWQQIVKLQVANVVEADAYMMVDSDCFFVKPFDPHALNRGPLVPIFREQKDFYKTDSDSQKWHEAGRRLLGLPVPSSPFDTGFVGPHVFWRRDVLRQLYRHLGADVDPKGWIQRIGRNLTFSEYVLYGMFADRVLGLEAAGHYPFDGDICHNYWPEIPMSAAELRDFRAQIPEEKIMVMINAKSLTPVPLIRSAFDLDA